MNIISSRCLHCDAVPIKLPQVTIVSVLNMSSLDSNFSVAGVAQCDTKHVTCQVGCSGLDAQVEYFSGSFFPISIDVIGLVIL